MSDIARVRNKGLEAERMCGVCVLADRAIESRERARVVVPTEVDWGRRGDDIPHPRESGLESCGTVHWQGGGRRGRGVGKIRGCREKING